MKYCEHCGKEIIEKQDYSYLEWFLFALLLPYLGIILYFWFKMSNKKAAQRLLQGSLASLSFIMLGFAVIILYVVLIGLTA